MNILHMRYAYEVAKAGSLSKASEVLMVAVPNISRSIKELESDLNISIFDRTAKGMSLTPEGEEFINYAQGILRQIEHVENIYKGDAVSKQTFSVSAPRACYISEAFAEFSNSLTNDAAEIFYKETNSQSTINKVVNNDYNLGIIRYAENYEKYFDMMFKDKGLKYEVITEFSYNLITSDRSDLACKNEIRIDDLSKYIEIAHADLYVPSLPYFKVIKEELSENISRRIFVFERASQLDLLSKNKDTYMWVSLVPDVVLNRYNLVLKKCSDKQRVYKDVLIYKKGYKLSVLDKRFISVLKETKVKHSKNN